MISNKALIDWDRLLQALSQNCTSDLAREKISQMQPLLSAREAIKSFHKIEQFKHLLLLGQRPFMESLDLFYGWSTMLKKNAVFKTIDLKDIRYFLTESLSLTEYLNESEEQYPVFYANNIILAEEPISAINQLINSSGEIRTDASEKLYSLFQEKRSLSQKIEKLLEKLVKLHEMENIVQDKYFTDREGRLVIPVKSGMQKDIAGIVHATSQSRQTVFLEPQEVVPMNNRLKNIDQDISEEIESLMQEISQYMFGLKEQIFNTKETMLECDELFAKAKLALFLKAHAVEFSTNEIFIKNVRHPILTLQGEKVIPNTVHLTNQEHILLLSGPNAGGKTVLLKSVGLAAEMARHGLPVCADKDSKLPFFKDIVIAVGDLQSVDKNLSTFAGHLNVLNQALKHNGFDQLLLIDEICGSTDPEEGTALARSFINEYAKNNCFAVITSHLSPLKSGWPKASKVINGSLEYDDKTGRPTYQFIMGIAGESLALQTAIRSGVEKSIIEQAIKFLSPEMKQHQTKLAEVEQLKKDLIKTQTRLESELQQANKEKSKYQHLVEKIEQEKTQILGKEIKQAKASIDSMLEKAKVEHTFKKHENLMNLQANLPKLVKTKVKKQIELPEQFQQAYPPGTKVFIESLGQDAIVQSKLNKQGKVNVLAGSMQALISWKDILPPQVSQKPTGKILQYKQHTHAHFLDQDRTIDLRGLKIDEALARLDAQLDTASLHEEDRVKIIHGHGTENLKRAIRQHLSRSPYIKQWQAGTKDHGGDGVSWAEL